jgi:hypothetical protein
LAGADADDWIRTSGRSRGLSAPTTRVAVVGDDFLVTSAERARNLARPPVYLWGMGQGHPGGDPADTLTSGAVIHVPSNPVRPAAK